MDELTTNTVDAVKEQEQSTFPALFLPTGFPNGGRYDEPRLDTIVSNDVVRMVEIVVVSVLCGVISSSGLVANVINILVFVRQGVLSSSSNASLLALAIADMGCLIPVLCNSVNYALHYLGIVGVFLTPRDFFEALVIWPHIMCMQIASWITAYIAFERCISVLLPFRVKSLFSARKLAFVTTLITLIGIISFMPTFLTQNTQSVVDPTNNRSGRVIVLTDLHIEIVTTSDIFHAIILRPLALIVVFVCTQITICRVKLSSTWRKTMVSAASPTPTSDAASHHDKQKTLESATSPSSDSDTSASHHDKQNTVVSAISTSSTSATASSFPDTQATPIETKPNTFVTQRAASTAMSKEKRLIKLVTAISCIFMACNAPDILGVLIPTVFGDQLSLAIGDNVFFLIMAGQLTLESINSSINIFVYYRMSSMYRQTFQRMMSRNC